jgi:hypothetical protein
MLGRLQETMNRLSTREKVMLGVMASAICAFIIFLGVFLVADRLVQIQDGLDGKRAALETLMKHKDAYLKRSANQGDHKAKIDGNTLDLTKFADKHSKAAGVPLDGWKPTQVPLVLKKRAPGSRGDEKPDLWEERLEVTFKRVGLKELTEFLDRIDKETLRPVAIKKLNVKTLWSDREKLSGALTLVTWKKPEEEE